MTIAGRLAREGGYVDQPQTAAWDRMLLQGRSRRRHTALDTRMHGAGPACCTSRPPSTRTISRWRVMR